MSDPAQRAQSRPGSSASPRGDDRPGLTARRTAAQLLAAVIDAKTPLDGLTDNDTGHPAYLKLEPRDRLLVRAILVSALRFRRTIERALGSLIDKPLPRNATALSHLLHVGAAQILFLDVPDSAAVDLAVSHAQGDTRSARFASLVNAVLRRLARDKAVILPEALERGPEAPDWFASMLDSAYGAERAHAILAAHRIEAPVDFTVKSDPAHWAEALGGIVLPIGTVRVARPPAAIPDLAGYADGAWWVQDAAAALPARLFGSLAGKRALDVCAAPGGKTAQLAAAGAAVTAVDISANRLKRLRQNVDRLGLDVETVQGDIAGLDLPAHFDAVLLDAPCSSTGTVRRHPDVPWTKSEADVEKLAAVQARLLDRAASFVAPGGRLVFSNCSLAPAEGEALVAPFLTAHPGFVLDPIGHDEIPGLEQFVTALGTLRTTPDGLDLGAPEISGLDGFFAARFRRDR